MNHPGFYKDKSLEFSFLSDLNLEKIGKNIIPPCKKI